MKYITAPPPISTAAAQLRKNSKHREQLGGGLALVGSGGVDEVARLEGSTEIALALLTRPMAAARSPRAVENAAPCTLLVISLVERAEGWLALSLVFTVTLRRMVPGGTILPLATPLPLVVFSTTARATSVTGTPSTSATMVRICSCSGPAKEAAEAVHAIAISNDTSTSVS
jgi:hypothetical protein